MTAVTTITTKRTPIDGARRKGGEAARQGLPLSACPYADKRSNSGRLTWSRAFRSAWFDGYREACQLDMFTGEGKDHFMNMATVRSANTPCCECGYSGEQA